MKLVCSKSGDTGYSSHSFNTLLGGVDIEIAAATLPGDEIKPNEDAYAVVADKDLVAVAVFDGVTSLQALPALGEQTGAHFASSFLTESLTECVGESRNARDVLIQLNERLLAASVGLGAEVSDPKSLPSSTATLVIIESSLNVQFAHVGDSFGVSKHEGGEVSLFTSDQNSVFDNKIFQLIERIAKRYSTTNREARNDPEVQAALKAMYVQKNNNQEGDGCGLVNGDPAMVQYVESGVISSEGLSSILLATDGLVAPGWDISETASASKLVDIVETQGLQKAIEIKRDTEDQDPDWKHTRYKHSDDATGLLVRFANS